MPDLQDLLGVAEFAWFGGHAVPELIRAGRLLRPHAVLDGEIVIADVGGPADFGALQERPTLAHGSIRDPVRERPAVLLVFDLLELAGESLLMRMLDERRKGLVHEPSRSWSGWHGSASTALPPLCPQRLPSRRRRQLLQASGTVAA